MPHIEIPRDMPGIIGLFAVHPDAAKPLNELAQVILRGPSPLTPGERELIAAYVSYKNDCFF